MDSTSILIVSISVSSYIVFGIVLVCCMRSSSAPHGHTHEYLARVVNTATMSIEKYHPTEHPTKKKQRITQLAMVMLAEQKYQENTPFSIDALIDESMLQVDTDPKLRAIRLSSEDTKQITPPAGMMSLGVRQRAVQKTGKLV